MKERLINEKPFYVPQVMGGWERPVVRACFKAKLPMMWKGPTSTGKTRLATAVAHEFQLPLLTVQCTTATQPYHLIGSERPANGDGMYFKDGPLTLGVRSDRGALVYINEILRADREVDAALYSLADNRRQLYIDQTLEVLAASDRVFLVIDYNPPQFSMNKMEGPTKQRFVGLVFAWAPAPTEAAIIGREVWPKAGILTSEFENAARREQAIEAEVADRLTRVSRWGKTEMENFCHQVVRFLGQIRNMHKADKMMGEPGPRLAINAAYLVQQGIPEWVAICCAVSNVLTDDPAKIAAINDEIQKTGGFPKPSGVII